MHNTYNLTVNGHTVKAVFTRVNDSRRIDMLVDTKKRPNLFQVSGAIRCRMEIAHDMAPGWFKENALFENQNWYLTGASFIYYRDRWNSCKGRLEALKDTVQMVPDKGLIIKAFMSEQERRRVKKGPARQPKAKKVTA